MAKKLTVNISPQIAKVVQQRAADEGATQTEIVRRSLGTYDYLAEQVSKGARIMIVDQNGKERELVFERTTRPEAP